MWLCSNKTLFTSNEWLAGFGLWVVVRWFVGHSLQAPALNTYHQSELPSKIGTYLMFLG